MFVVNVKPGISTTDLRAKGFEAGAKEAGLDYIGQQYSQDDPGKAASIVKAILASNPDLKGIFATNLFSAEGAASGLKEAGKLGDVKIVGFDAGPKQVQDLKDGLVQALIAQRPAQIGSLGVQQAVAALDGQAHQEEDRDGLRLDHQGQPRPEPGRALQGELLNSRRTARRGRARASPGAAASRSGRARPRRSSPRRSRWRRRAPPGRRTGRSRVTPSGVSGLASTAPGSARVCGWPSRTVTIGAARSTGNSPSRMRRSRRRGRAGLQRAEQQVGEVTQIDVARRRAQSRPPPAPPADAPMPTSVTRGRPPAAAQRVAAGQHQRARALGSRHAASAWSIGRVDEPEVGALAVRPAEPAERVQQRPLEVLPEGRLPGGAAGLLEPDRRA